MAQQYLPANARERIQDLMKERKITQNELAKAAGCNESTLSRFLTGKTDKLSDENIIAISGAFNVTTDFLLGLTDVPDRTNYDLAELGLSVETGKTLYTSKRASTVINAMVESKSFPALAELIYQYMEGTAAEGYAAQNKLYSMLASLAAGENSEAAALIRSQRMPAYQADVTHIERLFKNVLSEMRQDHSEKIAAAQKLTSDVMNNLISKLPKKAELRQITPEQLANAVVSAVGDTEQFTPEQLNGLKDGILPLFQQKPIKDADVDK